MRKEVFIICDPDKEYTRRFTEYLLQKKTIPFKVEAFTTAEGLLAYARGKELDILLISPELYTREIREQSIATVVLLTDGEQPDTPGSPPCVNKYQACPEVIRRTMACCQGEAVPDASQIKRGTELTAVYSPVGRCGKTLFALALSQILGRRRPALYLNLEAYSGFEAMTGKVLHAGTLSDLLYYAGQEKPNLVQKTGELAEKAGRFDLVPPVHFPWDIRSSASGELLTLLTALERGSRYEHIILDIGTEVEDVIRILRRCGTIYMPVLKDPFSLAKIAQFENILDEWGEENIKLRIRKIRPPRTEPEASGSALLEQLEYGELGDYVRQLL